MSSSNINPETGEPVSSTGGRSPRFTLWVAFLVFASITMGSAVEVKNTNSTPAATWAVAGSAITFALTAILVICHLIPIASTLVVGTRIEGAVAFVLACFWAAIVAIVTNAGNELGVTNDPTNQVENGNLYYFSWAGFFTSIVLLVNYLKSSFGLDVAAYRNRAARLGLWAGLLAASLIVMGSSVRFFNTNSCHANGASKCTRTKLGISEGVLGIVFALMVIAMKLVTTSAPFVVEFITAIFLTILNGFGVAYLTSPNGPGSPIGNLYYSTWINFLCAAFLMASCWEQRSANAAGDAANNNNNKPDDTENMEDRI